MLLYGRWIARTILILTIFASCTSDELKLVTPTIDDANIDHVYASSLDVSDKKGFVTDVYTSLAVTEIQYISIFGCSSGLEGVTDNISFIKDRCNVQFPIRSELENSTIPGGVCTAFGKGVGVTEIVAVVTTKVQAADEIFDKLNNSSPIRLKYNVNSDGCIHQSSSVWSRQQISTDIQFIDVQLATKDDGVSFTPYFLGVVGLSCKSLVAWDRNGSNWKVIPSSIKTMPYFTDSVLPSASIDNSTLYIRCILDSVPTDQTLNGSVAISVSYFSQSSTVEFVPSYDQSHSNPPISNDYPYICAASSTPSRLYFVPDAMYITSISLQTNSNDIFTVYGCSHDAILPDNEFPCDGDFMPIFTGQNYQLPLYSSIFLGPNTDIDVLVLHGDEINNICLEFSVSEKTDYQFGVLLLAAPLGIIPPLSEYNLDLSCVFDSEISITGTMYRVHTHKLGKHVTMWIRRNDDWTQVVSEDTKDAMFATSEHFHIRKGDIMNVRCTYDTSNKTVSTSIGPDVLNDEMCNFYLYYIIYSTGYSSVRDCFNVTDFNPPNILKIDHDLPRDEHLTNKSLLLNETWSGRFDFILRNGRIINLQSLSDDDVVVLQSGTNHYSAEWFDEDNKVKDKGRVIKHNIISVVSIEKGEISDRSGTNRFYLPSGLFVTKQGDLLITDLVLHQVYKFKGLTIKLHDKPMVVLGTAFIPGSDQSHFCMPTSVVCDLKGNIYVGDGLCNSRIVKFDEEGSFTASYGRQSLVPNVIGGFAEVTHITIDHIRDVLYASDAINNQIHVLDFSGEFLRLFNLQDYRIIGDIEYSQGMDALLVVSSFNFDSSILILDPITGGIVRIIHGITQDFRTLAWLPNNQAIVGTSSGKLWQYLLVSDNSPSNISGIIHQLFNPNRIVPLVHYLYRPGFDNNANATKERTRVESMWDKYSPLIITMMSVVIVIPIFVFIVKMAMKKFYHRNPLNGDYEICEQNDAAKEGTLHDGLHEIYEDYSVL